MIRFPTTGDLFKSIGYSEKEERLEIEFRNKTIWSYYGVPKDLYDSFISLIKGREEYFKENIEGKFPSRRIDKNTAADI